MGHSSKGISAKQLERDLSVHYETAWYMAKRIRRAMKHDIFQEKLCGIVKVDDAVVKSNNGRRWEGGSNVVGMLSCSGPARMVVLNKLCGDEIRPSRDIAGEYCVPPRSGEVWLLAQGDHA